MAIVKDVTVVINAAEGQYVTFPSYTSYQDWKVRQANWFVKPYVQWKILRERQMEAKLEDLYGLPIFTLRGALWHCSIEEVQHVLHYGLQNRSTLSQVLFTLKDLADPLPATEPSVVHLPIRVLQTKGSHFGTIYHFPTYDGYFEWKCSKSNWLHRKKLVKKDNKDRIKELLLSIKFKRPINYFRGCFSIDYFDVLPKERPTDLLTENSFTFEPAIRI